MTPPRKAAFAAALLFAITLLARGPAAHAEADAKIDEAIDKAVAFLKSRQAKDGTWSKTNSPGITGIVLAALLNSGKVGPTDETAEKALKFIESMIDPKEGHIASTPPNPGGKGRGGFHKNYITSVNLIALKATGQAKYAAVIDKATEYLKKLQWDEKQAKSPKDPYYGGVGYGPDARPDMSNTMFFLDAMKAAGVPSTDSLYKKAVVFISRCQNLKGEHNDQPWAGKINDGSFIYVLAQGKGKSKSKAPTPKDDRRPGYGSMTYAGLKMLNLCGLPRDDERFKKAFEWVAKNYTLDENPGRRALAAGKEGAESQGLYYYLWTMAKCLDTLGVDEVVDASGKKHDWRAELAASLAKKQRKDGSWVNESGTWMESNPDLVTAYALLALSHCKTKSK